MTLSLFVLSALLLVLLLALVVVWPWLRPARQRVSLVELNVSVFRERLAELDGDHAAGRLDDASYLEQKTELERQLLAVSADEIGTPQRPLPRLVLVMVFLWVPIFSILAYAVLSDRQALYAYWAALDQHGPVADQLLTGQLERPTEAQAKDGLGLLQAMQQNLYQHPLDAQRWLVLSQAYTAAEAIEPALQALARAYRLAPTNDQIGMTYAQMRFFSQEGKLDATARQIVSQILARQPTHEGALMLLAMGSYRAAEYPQAIDYLTRLKTLRQAEDPSGAGAAIAQLDDAIAKAQVEMQAAASSRLEVEVLVDPALLAKLQPTDQLFVYARALQGPPIPYAAQKLGVSELIAGQPLVVALSDATSMMAGRTISSARAQNIPLVVGARISHTGNAIAEAGDFESLPVPIGSAQRLTLKIDQMR